jgi:dihydropteroate synthase
MAERKGGRKGRGRQAMDDVAVYLRPTSILTAADAEPAIDAARALPLAGTTSAFSEVEYIRRGGGEVLERRCLTIEELITVASFDGMTRYVLDNLMAPRADFAGLQMDRPHLMGILNVTPDSFSDGGDHTSLELAIAHARDMAAAGASIIDIGGESTRPDADEVSVADEIARTIPVIQALGDEMCLSIDTRKSAVMAAAAEAGARMINDVTALAFDDESLTVAAATGLPVILMHSSGPPKEMQSRTDYADVVLDVCDYLRGRLEACVAAGIPKERVAVDPGIGFGKTFEQNEILLRNIGLFHSLGVPILLGASRKGFMKGLPGGEHAKDRVHASVAVAVEAARQGVQLLRVHDVAETAQALAMADVLHRSG